MTTLAAQMDAVAPLTSGGIVPRGVDIVTKALTVLLGALAAIKKQTTALRAAAMGCRRRGVTTLAAQMDAVVPPTMGGIVRLDVDIATKALTVLLGAPAAITKQKIAMRAAAMGRRRHGVATLAAHMDAVVLLTSGKIAMFPEAIATKAHVPDASSELYDLDRSAG